MHAWPAQTKDLAHYWSTHWPQLGWTLNLHIRIWQLLIEFFSQLSWILGSIWSCTETLSKVIRMFCLQYVQNKMSLLEKFLTFWLFKRTFGDLGAKTMWSCIKSLFYLGGSPERAPSKAWVPLLSLSCGIWAARSDSGSGTCPASLSSPPWSETLSGSSWIDRDETCTFW